MWTKKRSLYLSKAVTILFMLLLIGGAGNLPGILSRYIIATQKSSAVYLPLLLTLYASAIPAGALLICLYRLLQQIGQGKVFIDGNVRLLRIISWCCFAIGAIYGIFCIQYALAVLIAFAAIFMALILRVIKNVFEQAIIIKNENDFTI